MERDYDSGVSNKVTFFVGHEVEHTPAFGKKTLFVVGIHEPNTISDLTDSQNSSLVESKHITHIYFGANQSFAPADREEWKLWTDMVHVLLEEGYWCTLDLDVSHIEELHKWGLFEKQKFIPMISVKLPGLLSLGYNATIKLDDTDFKATNPGVWCHAVHELIPSNKFTGWDDYTSDEIVK